MTIVRPSWAGTWAGAGFDIKTTTAKPEHDVMGALGGLLSRAQDAGSVRPDIDTGDMMALITGCLAREPDPTPPPSVTA